MTTIQNVYNDFRTNYSDSPEYAVDFFNRNAIFLNNRSSFVDYESLLLFIELTWQELNYLFNKVHYNSMLDLFEKRISFIDSEIIRLDSNQLKNDWYYGLYYFKGMGLYNLKEYKKASLVFKMLVKIDPKNDQYAKWLRYSRAGQSRYIINIAWIICIAITLCDSFFKSAITNSGFRLPLMVGTFIAIVTLGLYEYILNRSLRKIKR